MNCPDCDRQLYGDTCSCGWTKNKSHVTGNPFKYGIEIDGFYNLVNYPYAGVDVKYVDYCKFLMLFPLATSESGKR